MELRGDENPEDVDKVIQRFQTLDRHHKALLKEKARLQSEIQRERELFKEYEEVSTITLEILKENRKKKLKLYTTII